MRLIDRRKQKFHFYCLSKETFCITVYQSIQKEEAQLPEDNQSSIVSVFNHLLQLYT
eukprot:01109.XXX_2380_2052_1 [CDS] Oithona nana genome sequencing.